MATKEIRRSFQIAQDGSGLKIGIVSAHSHPEVVGPLVTGTKKALLERGVGRNNLRFLHVMRPFDLPFAAKAMLQREKTSSGGGLDGIICLGCMVRDENKSRFDFESEAVALGIMKLNLKADIPVVYGVLTCVNEQQALGFVGQSSSHVAEDHGWEWAKAVISLARLSRSLKEDAEEEEHEKESRVSQQQQVVTVAE